METVSRHFVFIGEIEVMNRLRDSVDELEVGCLLQTVRNAHGICSYTYEVAHRFKLHSACHTSRCLGFLNLSFIDFQEIPYSVVWMTEDPEIVSANVRKFL